MNLTELLSASKTAAKNSTAGGTTANQATAKTATAPVALQKAGSRIAAALTQTTTHLSNFGKLKSAVSEVQLASRALHSLSVTASAASVKLAAGNLVTAYNSALKAARAAAAVTGASVESGAANRASRELLQSVAADAATLASLKKMGISVMPDGTLVLDAKALEAASQAGPAALQSALASLGQQIDKAATRELSADGAVAAPLDKLNHRASVLKLQQQAMTALGDNMAAMAKSNAAAGYGAYGNYGLAAYLK
jgi:flagellar capping protein FliD